MPRLPLAPYRRRPPRRQLFAPMAAGIAARRIQAAARGFLARRQVARMRRPRLMSPMDISKIKRRKTQGQIKSTTRAVMPKYRIGSLIGTAKSSRKVKGKMDPLVITEHDDRHATVSQPMVAYWGYSDAGSLDQQLEMGVRALVNMFARRSGLKPCNIYQAFADSYLQDYSPESGIRWTRLVIAYQGVRSDGTITRDESIFNLSETMSIFNVTQNVMTDLKAQAAGTAFRPVRAILQTYDSVATGTAQHRTFATYDLENVMIDFSFMRKYKWQNVTPADTSQAPGEFNQFSVNDINANPLSGKIYQFKHRVPQVQSAQLDNTDLPELANIQAGDGQDGALKTNAFRVSDNYNADLEYPFKQPFKAMQIFKDTISEDKVYMPPGGYKQLIRKGKKTMNFTRFVAATVLNTATTVRRSSGDTVPERIGSSTIWALEPVIRTVTNETVRIATQMETWYTCKARAGNKTVPVVQINTVGAGTNFQT